MQELQIHSSLDNTLQPSLFFYPGGTTPVPLVVGLHTWSYNRHNQEANYLPLCEKYGWALLLPEFRGANLASNPQCHEACGSDLAIADIADAIGEVVRQYPIDGRKIFLLGCSGGGHMALLTAAHHPDLFRGIDVWCPVTDLRRWHAYAMEQNLPYAEALEACLGQPSEQYLQRSPIHYLEALATQTLSLHHGRHDEIVPYCHSLKLALELEKSSKNFYFDFFDGGHEQYPELSFSWFAGLAGKSSCFQEITG